MNAISTKQQLPVDKARRYLEPGPIVLVSSHHDGESDVMTLGWHSILNRSPSLVGCVISEQNYSHHLIRQSRECVINLPTTEMTKKVIGIGNTTGAKTDKFSEFDLCTERAQQVSAPLIKECYGHFECRLYDDALIDRYNYFIFEVVAAQVMTDPEYPTTLHYTGDGIFMVAGEMINRRELFSDDMLD
ncbi:flavin reductase [Pseudidiomarina salinarum]|uniref:Flavin reductase n=1 Tax=Pseudidiomarina salinarum TaxID=435908 RepID=A0A094IYS4_9GAMM|nr:flavin reductase family protein [Pseudidiomarina salinarum]KFZ30984.1 flavin reductase [Pseudidiomarina salinarum]RUO71470.1 flavin reductase family protein [Pseudidiomarina salinarum]